MFKYLSILLFSICLVLGGAIAYQNYKSGKAITDLQNQLAREQKIVKETQTAYSQLAIKTDEITLQNKELQKVINKKDEDILAAAQVALQWKDKYFQELNANQTVVDPNGNVVIVEIPKECKELRYKVEFGEEKENIKVSGFTLTNPPEASIKLEFTKPLILSLVLTKKDNDYKVYVDPNDPAIIPTEIQLKVNPELFNIKWYERLLVNVNLGIATNKDIVPSAKIMYYFNLSNSMTIAPFAGGMFSSKVMKAVPFFGIDFNWYLFR